MSIRPSLINLTLKLSGRNRAFAVVKERGLLEHPFCRAISRTTHNAAIMEYQQLAEPVAALVKQDACRLNWEECSVKRARELLDRRRSLYYLAYSGGIDSTSMLAAFLLAASSDEKKKLRVFMSGHSIQENPTFFFKHVIGLPLLSSMQDISSRLLEEDAMLVTGECGDQLFGSDMLQRGCSAFGEEVLSAPFEKATPQIFSLFLGGDEGAGGRVFDWFRPIAQECPFPIRTTHDFFWWFNFTQKWQHVKYRFLSHASWNLEARYGIHVQPFYDSLEFQLWSLANHDQKIRKTWDSYKFPVKDFLYKFTGDSAQLKLVKQQSLEKTFLVDECRLAVASDLSVPDSLEKLASYVRTAG